ncbi:MAG: hypothetical protein DMG23_15005 [Acidobacteria bacterium]|nr:MAG: hypothetical protein DMG23_15005 [Acidobacteriota bacterium]
MHFLGAAGRSGGGPAADGGRRHTAPARRGNLGKDGRADRAAWSLFQDEPRSGEEIPRRRRQRRGDRGPPKSREFAAKEKVFKQARNNYAYHQINKVQELDPDGNVEGTYEQDWDIVFDDNGKRIERVTYAPPDTLKGLMVTGEDLNSMRNVQPFVLTTDELPDYDVKYLGHAKLDEITAYVFSIRPRAIEKGRLYFQGVVWVDDRDLQIVKTEGKTVPEVKGHKDRFNLFPRFTTYREQIDGKFWFPTFTIADDTLYFPDRPVHIKEVIKYTEYKQFKAIPTIRVISEMPPGELDGKPKSAPVKDSPLKK